jgi:hypothetical protein
MFYLVNHGFTYSELYDMEVNDFRFMTKKLSKFLEAKE